MGCKQGVRGQGGSQGLGPTLCLGTGEGWGQRWGQGGVRFGVGAGVRVRSSFGDRPRLSQDPRPWPCGYLGARGGSVGPPNHPLRLLP